MAIETQTEQSQNTIGRDQAGRDITYNISNNNHYGQTKANIPILKRLLEQFEEELKSDPKLSVFIEELDYYNKPFEGDVLGLEKKLTDGNLKEHIRFGLRAKERFYKKLFKFQYSEFAQRINLHLLSWVEKSFELQIYPKIVSGCSPEEACALVDSIIVNPLLAELENVALGYTSTELSGMLYYLTGNCHLKWAK